MKVTSADVAERAGVSRATVSYVLNDTPNQTISAPTRAAVLAAAQELGYRPNAAARALRQGYSPVVLFPLSGLRIDAGMGAVAKLMAGRLGEVGLTLVTDLSLLASPEEQLSAWLRLQPAVVVDLGAAQAETLQGLEEAGVVILTPETRRQGSPLDVVGERIRACQLQHLLDSGRRKLLMVCPDPASGSRAYDRPMFERLGQLVTDAGGTLTVHHARLDRGDLAVVVDRWRSTSPRPDAICAYNDTYAAALLTALSAQGTEVPGTVAVIGADNTDLGQATTPTLTSVTAGYEEFADQVVDAVTRALAGQRPSLSTADVPIHVVRRDSA